MPLSEFALIKQYFQQQSVSRKDVNKGIGDDCALLTMPVNTELAVSTDTLVADVHFFADVDPFTLGHKALAVNLSDLAAMGAIPAWVSLAITLPQAEQAWLESFANGFMGLAEYYDLQLIGGDTTKGPLSITVTIHGHVPQGKSLRRDQAKPGDWLYVSGTVGDAAAGLAQLQQKLQLVQPEYFINRLQQPSPRIMVGAALRPIASSCIDISDGLAQDLQHILDSSGCGAVVDLEKIPVHEHLKDLSFEQQIQLALAGGDDYELLFSVPEEKKSLLQSVQQQSGVPLTCIGRLQAGAPTLTFKHLGQPQQLNLAGWDHFTS
ncbi:thiamine-phosphate kinase [Motilimonas pumila]|uniref:Thiamine-monophosphate kinase n=1 Tax=Motilimonas pumila TaxID=2303987 RepID=A0A418YKP5_9GAMM|nr:thiamine-phosphate kinase [Motilimonas pumila]RJG51551.1 thiamine-phosphate kinase [Motilimonas pumila]